MQPFRIVKFRGGLAVTFNNSSGKRHRFALSAKNKKDATPEAVEIVTEFFRKSPDAITTNDVCDAYLKHLDGRPGAIRMEPQRALRKFFGPYKPSQITEDIVRQYSKERTHARTGQPISDDTLWTELGALRNAFNYAKKRRMITAESVPFIPRPSKPAPRDRPLSREQVRLLLKEAKQVPHLFIAILLLLGTAGRLAAVLDLNWSRVDFEKNTIDLRVDSKGPRKGRAVVPMNAGLKSELLKWQKSTDCDEVVSFNDRPIKSIKTGFNAAVKRAGLVDVRIHDLRHTAAVWMLESGSSIQRISQYLGHSSIDVTFKVYARYQPDFLRAEATALDVTLLLSEVSKQTKNNREMPISGIAAHFTSTQASIIVDRELEPDLAIFVRDHANLIIADISRLFNEFRLNRKADETRSN
jgi:integrase